MFRIKFLLTGFVIVFIGSQTTFLWEERAGLLVIPLTLILMLSVLYLLIGIIYHTWHLIKERFRNRRHLYHTLLLLLLLVSAGFIPSAADVWEQKQGKDVLIATYVGSGNCMAEIKLKDSRKFTITNFCFGATQNAGTYELKHDTIVLRFDDEHKMKRSYAVIKLHQYQPHRRREGALLYVSTSGKRVIPYEVSLNKLSK